MARNGLRSLWREPAVPDPPRRVWRDWALVGVLVPVAIVEAIVRTDVVWPLVSFALAVGLVPTLLWRRTHPLAMVVIVFGLLTALSVVAWSQGAGSVGLASSAYVLLLPYSLMRWGSGRQIVLGLPLLLVCAAVGIAAAYTNTGEAALGAVFFALPAVLGVTIRYRATARLRETDQVKLLERAQLARELHDSVAHHVSAIAIQAQAGQVVASTSPENAIEALRVIEAEASRALAEMRSIVGALRDDQAAELTPQQGIEEIRQLAGVAGGSLQVDVEVTGDVGDIGPAVGAAAYRLTQESITNAVRHSRHATRVQVRVSGEDDCVRLTIIDDGDPASDARPGWGYGLIGMTERAALLGGTLEAGPGPGRGWTVSAVLPRATVAR